MGLAAEGIITEESVNLRSIEIIQIIEIIQKRKIEKKLMKALGTYGTLEVLKFVILESRRRGEGVGCRKKKLKK